MDGVRVREKVGSRSDKELSHYTSESTPPKVKEKQEAKQDGTYIRE